MIKDVNELFENKILLMIPKIATDVASSIPDTAIMSVGIPFATPYPLALNRKRHETTTAGDTAAITAPSQKFNEKITSIKYFILKLTQN